MNEPIRILNLFTIMNRGGAETMVMNYYRAMDRTKIQFDFMVHREERGAYDDEIEALGGRIYRMCPISLKNLIVYQKKLKDFFSKHKEYRILHAHMSEMAYFIFKEAVKHNIDVRICHAHSNPNFLKETLKEKLKVLPRLTLVHLIRPLVTDRFCCSIPAGKWLFGDVDNLIQLNNAIDSSKYKYDKEERLKIRHTFGWENKIVIGHVGRLIKIKNQSFLINLLYRLKRKYSNSILVLVGDGPEKKHLLNKAKELGLSESVIFTGSRNDVNLLLKAMDIFVFPSLYEGLPVSLVEAQAAGLPCVVSDKVSIQSKIIDNYFTVSLKTSMNIWLEYIENAMKCDRVDTSDIIINKGFDITSNSQCLADFYIKKYNIL